MPWFTDPGGVLSKCHRWRENVGLVVSQGIVGLETLTGNIMVTCNQSSCLTMSRRSIEYALQRHATRAASIFHWLFGLPIRIIAR